jgi:lipopolysaccharide export system protein LptA
MVSHVVARGGVRFEGEDGLTVRAGWAERDRTGQIALRGEGEDTPTILDTRRTVVAREIDVLPGGHVLEARGDVDTSIVAGTTASNGGSALGPLFAAEQPVQVRSAELLLDTESGDSLFTGTARAVQEDRMLRANRLHVLAGGERAEAEGDVRLRMFREDGEEKRIPILVDASSLSYRGEEGHVGFGGGVRYQEDTFTLAAETLEADLSPAGGFSSARALGEVRLTGRGRDPEGRTVEYHGFADRIDYDVASGEAVLYGGEEPARLVNPATAEELQGPELRVFLGEDRIVAGGAGAAGRTTIRPAVPEEGR